MPKSSLSFQIVTPSFKQAKFIEETIESVLSQEYPLFTYHVQDGGSTDGTMEVLESYAGRLTYESKKDNGQTDAINRGLVRGSGDIFAYINSDDYYLPGAFKMVARVFEDPSVNWLVGDAVIIDSKGQEIQSFVRAYKRIWRKIYHLWMLSVLNPIPQPSVFIRRSALDQVGNFDESLRYTMDYDMWYRLQQTYGPPVFLEEPLAAFRIHGDSKGGSQYEKQFAEEEQVAARYTKNSFLLWLHALHNQCILAAYGFLK